MEFDSGSTSEFVLLSRFCTYNPVSVRVRRDSWDKSKKKMNDPHSNFRTITRLETLATQAIRHGMQKQDLWNCI